MATRLQQYNGKGFDNNRVHVDYEKRTVKFQPVYRYKSKLDEIEEDGDSGAGFIVGSAIFSHVGFPITILVLLTIVILPIDVLSFTSLYIAFGTLIFIILLSIGVGILFTDPDFTDKHFPPLMAKLANFELLFFTFGIIGRWKNDWITKDELYKNFAIIPKFNNVGLKYWVYGDFAKQLKNIDVRNTYRKKPSEWYCIFEFKKKPKDGRLEVRYI